MPVVSCIVLSEESCLSLQHLAHIIGLHDEVVGESGDVICGNSSHIPGYDVSTCLTNFQVAIDANCILELLFKLIIQTAEAR